MKILFLLLILCINFFSFSQCDDFQINITVYHPTCPNYADGSISVGVIGANGVIGGQITNSSGIIMLNPTSTGTTPNILSSGWYYIFIYDESGCEIYDSVYLANPDEMEVIMNITLPSSSSACDGIAEVDTVLFYNGSFMNLGFYWAPGGPGGIGQIVKSDLCYGNYSVTVNNELGCGVTRHFSVGNLNINENPDTLIIFSVYPNPARNQFWVDCSNLPLAQNETILLRIYDLSGREVYGININSSIHEIDASLWKQGSYLLVLTSEQFTATKKLVVW